MKEGRNRGLSIQRTLTGLSHEEHNSTLSIAKVLERDDC